MKKYRVNTAMFVLSIVYSVFLVTISVTLAVMARPLSAVIFFLIALPFFFLTYRYGSTVRITDEGISLCFLKKERMKMKWNEIGEITVCGQKIFNAGNKKKCGTLYIIISREKLDDDKRFNMMLKWPPRDRIYFRFSKEGLFNIQLHYTTPVEKYNIGMLDI